MRCLIVDTETTGLPTSRILHDDTIHDEIPYIVQFSYILFDTEQNEMLEVKDYIIKMQPNVKIPEASIAIHGITDEISQSQGKYIFEVLNKFCYRLKHCDVVIGHNVEFDIFMIRAELFRGAFYGKQTRQTKLCKENYEYMLRNDAHETFCTMKNTVDLCKIPVTFRSGEVYWKYPTLLYLHKWMFNQTAVGLHNSLNDIVITLRCYIKLKYDVDIADTNKCKCRKTNKLLTDILEPTTNATTLPYC